MSQTWRKTAFLSTAMTFGMIGTACVQSPQTFGQALDATKPIADMRVRYEGADFSNFAETAEALTLRARIGAETGEFFGTSALVEVDHVTALVDDYNSTTNGQTMFPVIADPETSELNRLQLRNTSLPDTVVTAGRQRIIYDDARFIGNVGWRQDEQTFDALRVTNTSINGLKLDAAYIDQVNTIFGDEDPRAKVESDSWLFNAAYKMVDEGPLTANLSGYAYLLDLSRQTVSTQTYGARLQLASGPVKTRFEYARQSDYGANPLDYSEDFFAVSGALSQSGMTVELGFEQLGGGSGVQAFSTPLATAHKFNGFADVFLATPVNGLKDYYAKVGYKTDPIGPLSFVNMFATYHEFEAETGPLNYGSEIDAVVATKVGDVGVLFKFADYKADDLATDRTRYSFQLDFSF
ncbi:MAG: hypothetical protein AAFP97_06475 [Pseudomonadota bacterium]